MVTRDGTKDTEQEAYESEQVEGLKVPWSLPQVITPVGELPFTLAVQIVCVPTYSVDGEHETEVPGSFTAADIGAEATAGA